MLWMRCLKKKMLAVEVNDLHKAYQSGTKALKGVSLQIKQGDFFGLLGLNGAGKTTLINTLVGLVKPTSGQININGIDLLASPFEAKRAIGIVPQEVNLNIFHTVKQVMFNHGGYYGLLQSEIQERYGDILKDVGLLHKEHSAVNTLSGGMKRRLMLARALLVDPKVLILDEPTAGVDVELRQDVWQLLKKLNQKGTTVLLTTHYMEEAEYLCKHLAILHGGRIIDQGHKSELCLSEQARHLVLHLQSDLKTPMQHDNIKAEMEDGRTLSLHIQPGADLSAYLQALEGMGCQVGYVSSPTSRLEQYFRSQTERE